MSLPSINLPTLYGFQDVAQIRFYMSRSLRQSQRSNHGHTMTLHTYNPFPMSLQSINFLQLMVSEIQDGQNFSRHLPDHPPKRRPIRPPWVKNNAPTALQGCGSKSNYTVQSSLSKRLGIQECGEGRVIFLMTSISF